jgi:hypothetical protein
MPELSLIRLVGGIGNEVGQPMTKRSVHRRAP